MVLGALIDHHCLQVPPLAQLFALLPPTHDHTLLSLAANTNNNASSEGCRTRDLESGGEA
jgi:hypothetical protein